MPDVKEIQTAAPAQEAVESATSGPVTPVPPPKPKKPAGKGRQKMIKRVIALVVLLAIVLGAGFGMWYLVFREDTSVGAPLTDVAMLNTIQSVVQGYGNAVPKESAAITLNAAGTVQEVYVEVGQTVYAGDPLYTIYSEVAENNLTLAQEEMDKLLEEANNLTVRAPFAGKLMDVEEFQPDQEVSLGTKIATLVNDRKLKLSLYFSYAYENDIRAGQAVDVSIPAVMKTFTGRVEKVNRVSFVSPEGAVHFEAVIVFDNPGTLTAGMDASAVLTAGDGSEIYPYENGQTQFYETRDVLAKASGPVVGKGNLLNHANVGEGEELLYLGSSTIDEKIKTQQTKLEQAQESMNNFNAVAPINGQVLSCALVPGQDVKEGDTAITISNTTTMVVDIQVDSRNIGFIQAGMTMELTDDYGNPCMGTVTNVAMQGEVGSGTTTYPVKLEVDNSMGSIYNGSWLNYKLVTAESVDCVSVPNQCIKRVNDVDGNPHTVVFVKAGSKPENAVEVDPSSLGEGAATAERLPTADQGFWPVPVTTGLSDVYNCEITEGLEVDTVVFTGWGAGQENGMGGGVMIG